jgi:CheY-like chemotaxis protein
MPVSDCRGLTVLVVADDDEFLDFLLRALKALGAYVVAAGSAERALSFMITMKPDVVVGDVSASRLDAFELVERMRASPKLRDVPAIAIAAGVEVQSRATQSGFNQLLQRPLDVDELCRAIKAVARETSRMKPRDPSRTFLLIVDDIPDNRQMYAEYLEYEGYRVEQAHDGEEALALVRAMRPDLIVMDLSMPGMDGWEATRRLKDNPATGSIPILVVSGHAFGAAERRAREAGADSFLTKPCLPDDLSYKIRAMLATEESAS